MFYLFFPHDEVSVIQRSRGSSLDCVVSRDKTLPQKIDPERLLQLVILIRAGRETFQDREELARGHLRLALKIASQYAAQFNRDGDDYASEAMFGIAHAIDRAKEKLVNDNITGWIIINIHRFIMDFRRNNRTMKTSRSNPGGLSKCQLTDNNLERYYSKANRSKSNVRDIRESLDAITEDDDDFTLLRMRESGFTYAEIAEATGKSNGTVVRHCKILEARYNRQE